MKIRRRSPNNADNQIILTSQLFLNLQLLITTSKINLWNHVWMYNADEWIILSSQLALLSWMYNYTDRKFTHKIYLWLWYCHTQVVERPFPRRGVFFWWKYLLKRPMVPKSRHSKFSETGSIFSCNLVHHCENLRYISQSRVNCWNIEKSVFWLSCA